MKRIDATDSKTIRYKFRKKRFEKVENLIRESLKVSDPVTVIDIGGRRDYWDYLSEDLRQHVIITTVNFEDELEDYSQKSSDLNIVQVVGDGCDLSQFSDNQFDISHSNSVIEHVGSFANMAKFSSESRRVAKRYYMQTPNLWFPLEPHFGVPFLHWLPAPTRIRLINKYAVGYSEKVEPIEEAIDEIDHLSLINASLVKTFFPDGEIHRERFALMTKSLITIGPN